MRPKNIYIILIIFGLCINFVSSELSNDEKDYFNKEVLENISCEQAKVVFDSSYANYSIPENIPFKNEVFNIYIDGEFFLSMGLIEKNIGDVLCDKSESPTYNIYITRNFIVNAVKGFPDIDMVDYYNQNRKSEDLNIEAIGFVRKVKMGFINLGLKVASWFN